MADQLQHRNREPGERHKEKERKYRKSCRRWAISPWTRKKKADSILIAAKSHGDMKTTHAAAQLAHHTVMGFAACL
ncbi:MAG: hypothetical protein DMG13_31435, partial [Acidobacteria bacterium]